MTAVLVFGGREYYSRHTVFQTLDELHQVHTFTLVIYGCADGADSLAGQWAESRRVPKRKFKADWIGFHGRAGPMRNAQMLREGRPSMAVEFPGNAGTWDMRQKCIDAGITPIRIRDVL